MRVHLDAPLVIDGKLDENIYRTVPAIDRFEQQVPREKARQPPRRQRRGFSPRRQQPVLSARLLDSQPDRIVANEMRHDNVNIFNGGDDDAGARHLS
ncbi:MAG: hypothetical protein U0Q11_21170 [Vicinamibacterales bacterium]